MPKIIAISDLHMQFKDIFLPKGDILVCAGDISWTGSIEQMRQAANWWNSLEFKHKIITWGNHEREAERTPQVFKELFAGSHVLLHEPAEVMGIKFFGSPYSPPFGNWAFMKSQRAMRALWKQVPDDTGVLITHTPPFRYLDKIPNGQHVGCKELAHRIKELKNLQYSIFGHIHYSYGKMIDGDVTYANAALVNEDYVIANPPHQLMYKIIDETAAL